MPSYTQINEKLVEVTLNNEEVFAKRGAMISYQGKVNFARSFLGSGDVQDLAMRSVTNEGYTLMVARGTGKVYYGYNGLFASIIHASNETVYVESKTLLAYDARLRTGTMFLGNQGGGAEYLARCSDRSGAVHDDVAGHRRNCDSV